VGNTGQWWRYFDILLRTEYSVQATRFQPREIVVDQDIFLVFHHQSCHWEMVQSIAQSTCLMTLSRRNIRTSNRFYPWEINNTATPDYGGAPSWTDREGAFVRGSAPFLRPFFGCKGLNPALSESRHNNLGPPGGPWGAVASRLTPQKYSGWNMEQDMEYWRLVPGKKVIPA
jgi:hypothetical protein